MLPVFVTGNPNKTAYLSRTLGLTLPHEAVDLDEIQSADPKVVVEHKVRQAYTLLGRPVLVEDTSLHFNALGGMPGPFIKFFLDIPDGLDKACRMLDGFDDRSAYGIGIHGYYDGKQMVFLQGKITGTIASQPRGSSGYGWDAIFEPDGYGGLTRAELDEAQQDVGYKELKGIAQLKEFLAAIHM